ncbi:hypothetical protein [Acinetobacter baumannii]|nr:hypothetical protein [Acinetobacter baumannii]HAW7017193.1 hypothetical protein [Acinetobacter baumannii]HAW7025276.1 hypothetical protein [Acinetobacter baumannii]HAW7034653.1 hypothetical protein [Acinetobacter baumannii]HAW7038718.1 hypothetical protein [Acinetobacter baumannii]
MLDLNKLRSEFEAQHSDKVFKIVKFDEATNAYCLHAHLPLTEINLSALAEINYGWDLWQKAKAQAVPDTHIVVPKDVAERIITHIGIAMCHPNNTRDEENIMGEDQVVIERAIDASESGAEG